VIGAIVLVIVLVVVLPMVVIMGGAVIAAALGWFLKDDAEARHAGSELVDLDG
jgi:hypothetical protein